MNYFSHKFTIYNNKCYFIAEKFNGVYMLDLESNEMGFLVSVPGEPIGAQELFREIICVDNKLFFIPDKASFIHVLDENATEIMRLKMEDRISDYFKSGSKFLTAFFINKMIYIIPYGYPALLMLNPHTYEITYFDDFIYDCEEADNNLHAGMFMAGKYIKNEICLLHRSSNKILFFDTQSKKYLFKSVGNKTEIYVDICFDGVFYWLITAKGELLRWHRETEEIKCIFDYKTHALVQTIITDWDVAEMHMFYREGYIWIFSYCYPAVKVNTKNGIYQVMEQFESGNYGIPYNKAEGYNHVCAYMDELKLYTFCHYKNILISYDFISNSMKVINLLPENIVRRKALQALLQGVRENKFIVDNADDMKKCISIGNKIFKELQSQI